MIPLFASILGRLLCVLTLVGAAALPLPAAASWNASDACGQSCDDAHGSSGDVDPADRGCTDCSECNGCGKTCCHAVAMDRPALARGRMTQADAPAAPAASQRQTPWVVPSDIFRPPQA